MSEPAAPTMDKPVAPSPFQMPMEPQGLTDMQKDQFKLYCQLRQQQYQQKMKAYETEMARYQGLHNDYQRKMAEFNASKQAS